MKVVRLALACFFGPLWVAGASPLTTVVEPCLKAYSPLSSAPRSIGEPAPLGELSDPLWEAARTVSESSEEKEVRDAEFELYLAVTPRLERFFRSRGLDDATTADCVHDTFLSVVTRFRKLSADALPDNVSGYFLGAAKNVYLRHLTARKERSLDVLKAHNRNEDERNDAELVEAAPERPEVKQLREAIANLGGEERGDHMRQVVELELEGYDFDEIARKLRLDRDTVKRLYDRAMVRLSSQLRDDRDRSITKYREILLSAPEAQYILLRAQGLSRREISQALQKTLPQIDRLRNEIRKRVERRIGHRVSPSDIQYEPGSKPGVGTILVTTDDGSADARIKVRVEPAGLAVSPDVGTYILLRAQNTAPSVIAERLSMKEGQLPYLLETRLIEPLKRLHPELDISLSNITFHDDPLEPDRALIHIVNQGKIQAEISVQIQREKQYSPKRAAHVPAVEIRGTPAKVALLKSRGARTPEIAKQLGISDATVNRALRALEAEAVSQLPRNFRAGPKVEYRPDPSHPKLAYLVFRNPTTLLESWVRVDVKEEAKASSLSMDPKLRRSFLGIAPDIRSILRMAFEQGLDAKEIAGKLGDPNFRRIQKIIQRHRARLQESWYQVPASDFDWFLSQVPENHVPILKAHFLEGKTPAEIAQETGLAVGMVDSALRRAFQKMKVYADNKDFDVNRVFIGETVHPMNTLPLRLAEAPLPAEERQLQDRAETVTRWVRAHKDTLPGPYDRQKKLTAEQISESNIYALMKRYGHREEFRQRLPDDIRRLVERWQSVREARNAFSPASALTDWVRANGNQLPKRQSKRKDQLKLSPEQLKENAVFMLLLRHGEEAEFQAQLPRDIRKQVAKYFKNRRERK